MNEKNKSAGINNMSNNISGGKQKVIKIPTIREYEKISVNKILL